MEAIAMMELESMGFTVVFILAIIYTWIQYKLDTIKKKRILCHRAHLAFHNAGVKTLEEGDHLIVFLHKCSICMEMFAHGDDATTLPCCHGFHSACIKKQLFQNRTCPVCNDDTFRSLGLVLTPMGEKFWEGNINSEDANGEIDLDVHEEDGEEEDLFIGEAFPALEELRTRANLNAATDLYTILILFLIILIICIFVFVFRIDMTL